MAVFVGTRLFALYNKGQLTNPVEPAAHDWSAENSPQPHKESLPSAPVLQHANHPGPIEIIQHQLNFNFFQTDVIDNVRISMYFISILFVCYKYIETPLSKHFLLNQSECLFWEYLFGAAQIGLPPFELQTFGLQWCLDCLDLCAVEIST